VRYAMRRLYSARLGKRKLKLTTYAGEDGCFEIQIHKEYVDWVATPVILYPIMANSCK